MTICTKYFCRPKNKHEVCEYQSLESTLIPSYEIGDRIDLFWSSMQKLKDPATQNLM